MKTKDKPTEFTVELKFSPMGGIGGGFREEWISGKGNGVQFSLDSGAGLGNPLLTLQIRYGDKGSYRYFTADIRPMLEALVDQLIKAKAFK